MAPVFWEITISGALLKGLVLTLSGIVTVWAVAELAAWVFPRIKGRHLSPKFFHIGHATN